MQRYYPEIFFKLQDTITCGLPWPKFEDSKNLPLENFGQFLKALYHEIINFQE